MLHYNSVVIGASFGASAALTTILSQLPKDYPLPLLVVIHIPRDRPSMLAEVLQASCQLHVKEAEDKELIQAGVVYIAPPDYHLLIEKNKTLSLSAEEPVAYSRPAIDVLFETAADAYHESLIGIILSGANEDGSNGLKCIEQQGGVVLIQKPEEAAAAKMPLSALNACTNPNMLYLNDIAHYLKEDALS